MPISRRTLIRQAACAATAAGSLDIVPALGSTAASATEPTILTLPPVNLHGYGSISASIVFSPQDRSSVTTIACESDAKAMLTQAKYLSDLERLPGVSRVVLPAGGRSIPARKTPSGGVVACAAHGKTVTIIAAAEARLPAHVFQSKELRLAVEADYESRTTVPMYLDRWDKYGLLCYFAPEVMPPGAGYLDQTYDYADGLNFVKDHEMGLIVWTYPLQDDFAEGCTSEQAWSWVQENARKMNIPVHINTQINPPQMWLANRYPDQAMCKAPQFVGGYYGVGHDSAGQSATSWLSQEAEDALLGVFQRTVRRFANDPNIVGWLEPHGETYEVPQKFFLESGPYADEVLRTYLRRKYTTLRELSQRWHGDPAYYRSWAEVRQPEVAEFAGFGPHAIDLRGTWRVKYVPAPDGHIYSRDEARGLPSPPPTSPAPPEWFQPEFDDSGWDEFTAPGNDRMLFLPRSPLVYRRTIEIPAEWLKAGRQVNLCIWDLANRDRDVTTLYVNGRQVPEVINRANDQHWSRFDITAFIMGGLNHIAILMPRAIICYRAYLARDLPLQYPHLGPHNNAQWVDMVEWNIESRGAQIRRGAEMIRQIDPHRSINFMAATDYADPVKQACRNYGGRFHDTGSMAGFWTDENSLLMSGAGLPVTAEPGNGAPNEREFKLFWGRWLTEAVNGVHYFQSWGEIAWNPEVLKVFEANRAMYEAVGKYHAPIAKVAVLFSLQSQWLTGFPWTSKESEPGGYYSSWNAAMHLINWCPRDGVGAQDFGTPAVDRFRVIIDSNSCYMNDDLLAGIEKYVKSGGVFITYGHTGRHTPTEPDSWPISRLSGYKVGGVTGNDVCSSAHGQSIYTPDADKSTIHCSGLRLEPELPACSPLLVWSDGSVAVGMRKLGYGYIVHFGLSVSGGDFVEAIAPLLNHFGANDRVPALTQPHRGLHMRHFISNSSLHDVWILFNESDAGVTTNLTFMPGFHPQSLIDLLTLKSIELTRKPEGDAVVGIELERWQSRMYLSPRSAVEASPLEWLTLQRNWWQGTVSPPVKRLPAAKDLQRFSLDLTEGWAVKSVEGATDEQAAVLTLPRLNDQTWERRTLGLWLSPRDHSAKRLVLRRKFTVPAHWTNGQIALCADVPYAQFFHETRMFVNGKALAAGRKMADGPYFDTLNGEFAPGSTYVIALDIGTKSTLIGCRGPIWLAYIPYPKPGDTQDLAGNWTAWSDPLHKVGEVALPGASTAMYLSRTAHIESSRRGKNVVIYYESTGGRLNLMFNGRLINHGDQPRQHVVAINVTPLVRFGKDNLVELAGANGNEEKRVGRIEIRYYEKGVYP